MWPPLRPLWTEYLRHSFYLSTTTDMLIALKICNSKGIKHINPIPIKNKFLSIFWGKFLETFRLFLVFSYFLIKNANFASKLIYISFKLFEGLKWSPFFIDLINFLFFRNTKSYHVSYQSTHIITSNSMKTIKCQKIIFGNSVRNKKLRKR